MGRLFGLVTKLGKGAWAVLGIGATGAAANVVINPKDGFVVNAAGDLVTASANIGKEAGVDSGFQGFYKFFEKLADFIESFTGEGTMQGMRDWAQKGMGENTATPDDIGANTVTANEVADPNLDALGNSLDAGDAVGVAAGVTGFGAAKVLGVRAIPLVASFAAAADGIYDTASYTLKGEFKNAAARFAGGAVETVAGLGGLTTYSFGLAGRELIENTSNAHLGTNVPDGEVVQVVKSGINFLTNDR